MRHPVSAVDAQSAEAAGERAGRPDATSIAAFVTLCTYTWFLYGVGPSLPVAGSSEASTDALAAAEEPPESGGDDEAVPPPVIWIRP